MDNYRELGVKLVFIVLAEVLFFMITPRLAQAFGSHPYELVTLLTSGAVIAYAVNAFFDSVKQARDSRKQKTDVEKLRKRVDTLTDLIRQEHRDDVERILKDERENEDKQ